MYDDRCADGNHVVEFWNPRWRHVYTAVTSGILIDVSTETASPGCIMHTVTGSVESHPVTYETFIVSVFLFVTTLKGNVSGFIQNLEQSGRSGVSGSDAACDDICFKSVLTVFKIYGVLS